MDINVGSSKNVSIAFAQRSRRQSV